MEGAKEFLLYPQPQATEVAYEIPKPGANPVLNGLPLSIGASLLSSSNFLSNYFWRNAGFDGLRSIEELHDFSVRLDPTVIPLSNRTKSVDPAEYTKPDGLRSPPSDPSTRYFSIIDFHKAYLAGTTTPTTIVESLLPLIRRDVDKPSKYAVAMLETKIDIVRKAAEASTLRYKEGKSLGVLDGVPVAIKDQVDLNGYKKTYGTTKDYADKEGRTSWCVEKWQEMGAVVIGTTNMHEIGMDTTNNNPIYGTPLNPYNSHYYTGGSSGGSASLVSSGLVPICHGADGGGSIRIPSSYCGIYGLKPSHSRVSHFPSKPSSVSVSGPMAANMVDLEVAYRVMAQPDVRAEYNSLFPAPRGPSTSANPVETGRKKILGVYRTWVDRADEPVKAAWTKAIEYFTTHLDYTVIDITIPFTHAGQGAHAMSILAEQAANFPDLSLLTPANKITMAVGSKTPSIDFILAQKMRHLLMQHLASLFEQHPDMIIVTPTTPNAGWHITNGQADLKHGISDANRTIRNMEYVWLANFCGLPAITWPMGFVGPVEGEGRVPVGMMGMGRWGAEDALIEFGYEGEKYVGEGLEGGRVRAEAWVDIFGLVGGRDS